MPLLVLPYGLHAKLLAAKQRHDIIGVVTYFGGALFLANTIFTPSTITIR
jgi:hypothetical protein